MLKVLVVGGGAREHALVWKLSQSSRISHIYVAPGNAGTAAIAQNLNISAENIEGLAQAARANKIDLAVIGPEAPLAAGIVDHLQKLGIAAFGPTKAAARIESSKVFAKELMQRHGIPCPKSQAFSSFKEARDYLATQKPPLVIKADGLAAGKGVTVVNSREEAVQALHNALEARAFGSAGEQVLVEEYLEGQETSLLAFTDGKTVVPLAPARDYKRAFDGDLGPNTGGMGSYCPPGFLNEALGREVLQTILEPAVRAMKQEGAPYQGVLYAGLMITRDGPRVLEFNARFGDPETQVILPRLKTDLVDILLAVVNGTLDRVNIEWSPGACVGVVMASQGYPGSYATGFPITGLDKLERDVMVFHAGTRLGNDGQIETSGGRVLTVVASGATLAEARNRVYFNLPCIRFQGAHFRKDIAAAEAKVRMCSPIQTSLKRIDPSHPDPGVIREAADIINGGGLVAFPTETVYGLGADALNAGAVNKVFEVKQRPPASPLIVLIANMEQLRIVARSVSPEADILIKKFWPGPLTLTFPKTERVPQLVTGGQESVSVRMPGNTVALDLIKACGVPVVGPSANLWGHPSPTTGEHVLKDLGGSIDLVLDAGEVGSGIESTILDLCRQPPVILRPGAITAEEIETHIGAVSYLEDASLAARATGVQYIPRADLILVSEKDVDVVAEAFRRFRNQGKKVGLITRHPHLYACEHQLVIKAMPQELSEYARKLFGTLRELDEEVDCIIAEGVEEQGLGIAIMDRLRRATSRRSLAD